MLNLSRLISPFAQFSDWHRRSIHRKFAVAVLPIIIGTVILILAVDEVVHLRHAREKLLDVQYRRAEGARDMLGELLSDGDTKVVKDLVATIAVDPDVSFVAVKDSAGNMVVSAGNRASETHRLAMYQEDFAYVDAHQLPVNGSFVVELTSQHIFAHLIERIRVKSLAVLSLTIFLFILIRLLNGFIVAAPLNRMIEAIEANLRAGTLMPLKLRGDDEIARLGRAYNAQTEQIVQHQAELRDANNKLEVMVSKRTEQLSSALARAERATQHIARIANQDEVTGLLNRRGFTQRLQQAIAASEADGTNTVLFLMDLDRFKNVNDTLGHAAGDELLQYVSANLKKTVVGKGALGRVGGDEFAVFLPGPIDEAEAAALATRILNAFKSPAMISGRPIHAGISIGISICPDNSRDAGQLMKNADIALYQAKESGRGRFVFFSSTMAQNVDQHDRIEVDLRRGMREKNGVAVHFQPKVDLRQGAVVGFEALVRWHQRKGGMIGPDQFLPIASERGMLLDLSEQIAEHIKEVAQHWSMKTSLPFTIALNIHADQLTNRDHLEKVIGTIRSSGLSMDRFTLEITEGCILGRGKDDALDYLVDLRRDGLKLSLDDFGTGYAALTHLKNLPMDELKIDKSFIQNLGQDSGDEAIIRAAVDLAHSFGMNVVAEGVETQEQLQSVFLLGCDQVQGNLFGRPEDSELAFRRLLGPERPLAPFSSAA